MVRTTAEEFPEGIDPEPAFPRGRKPLNEYLAEQAEETPDRTALNYYGREISYQELNDVVDRFATFLTDRGYGPSDTVLLYVQNCPQYYAAYHAAMRLGMCVSPCSPMAKEHRLRYQLTDSDAHVALAHDTSVDQIGAVRDETPLEDVVYVRYETYLPERPLPEIHEEMATAIDHPKIETGSNETYFSNAISDVESAVPEIDSNLDEVALLQYTSGTTGMPKGCEHTHWTILHKAGGASSIYGFDNRTRHLAVMPIFHVAGKLNAVDSPLIDGGTVILLTRFDTEALMEAIDEHRPNTGWMTTPMVRSVLGHQHRDEYDLTSIEEMPVTSFGQSLTEELCERWTGATGASMYESAYGLSETHTMDTFTRKLDAVEEGFVGRPAHNVEIIVRDWTSHEPLPAGETGEISVASPSVMQSYHGKPDETAATMYDEYVLTGDVGRLTEDGCLYFLGRRKNMIKSSGYSVSPGEVEIVLKEHEKIINAVVVGREHETRGEEVVAYVTLTDDSLTEDDLLAWSEDKLAAYKRPRAFLIKDSLPTTDVGKLDRTAMESEVNE